MRFIYFIRLSFCLFLTGYFLTTFSAYAQTGSTLLSHKISIRLSVVSLADALDQVQRISSIDITYNVQQLDSKRKVSIQASNESLQQVLTSILSGTELTYKQVGANIVIVSKPVPVKISYGSIEGVVQDYQTKESLPGCSVVIQNSTKGASTDAEGRFRLDGVAEGVYSLIFSYVGYKQVIAEQIQVKANAVTRVNQNLVADNVLGEVVVKATVQLENSTEISVINEIKGANNIVTGISNEQIARNLDRDGAEVVRRATGVTLVQDRFVVLRGLDPRYTLTMLNDIPTPSAESDRRAFSFDMLNSSILDRVMVYKTASPEYPSDFAGGVVKVYTKNSANARQLQIQLSTQYRLGSSFTDYYTYKGGKTDWLGFDDGTRNMPNYVPSSKEFPVVGISDQSNAENARFARSFSNNWNLMNARSNLDKRVVINYYASWKMPRMGYVNSLSSVTYTSTTNLNEIKRFFGYSKYNAEGVSTTIYQDKPIDLYNSQNNEQSHIQSVRLTAMQNFKWVFNDRHSIDFKNFFNQLNRDRVITQDYRTSTSTLDNYVNYLDKTLYYNFRSRSLYTGTLSGDHILSKPWLTSVNWRFGYGHTNDKQPDLRSISFKRRDVLVGFEGESDPIGAYQFNIPSATIKVTDLNTHQYDDLAEDTYTGAIDLEKKFASEASIKAGIFMDYRTRRYTTRRFAYNGNVGVDTLLTATIKDLPFMANQLFDRRFFRNDGTGLQIHDNTGFTLAEGIDGNDGYEANNNQRAGYVAFNLPLFNKHLTVYGGVRAEWNHFSFPGTFSVLEDNSIVQISVDQKKLYWLPSLNVSYVFTPKMQVRAAYGMTLNRPEFREVVPIQARDLDRNMDFVGNYKLTNAEIDNYDLRWEFYPEADELISIGAYYKTFRNAIELYSIAAVNFERDFFNFANTKQAKGYGLELEVRKRLSFIPLPLFEYMAVNANLTLLKTEIDISDQIEQGGQYNDLRRSIRPLQGSSPYSINVNLYYDNTPSGTQVSALYNVIGQRLTTVGNSFTSELYELPRDVIDLTVTQRINRYLRIRAGVQDILNQAFRIYRDRDRSRTYNPNHLSLYDPEAKTYIRDYMEEKYRPGSYFSLGLILAF
ncbi:TonB-dependent receptor [Cytophagaceae bacterium YF14B1]|uniref:TonB-dependent receptor n=1 Tax=Xanthocytophaga flava TaxID=3048013 RepID=A0AAE3UA90_9BACT|nr:TonB-dependent receptor [Xanthocytophaga flavus]MDJ1482539.1 TonB-dependent receptor [Xanthocytophaga flavus]